MALRAPVTHRSLFQRIRPTRPLQTLVRVAISVVLTPCTASVVVSCESDRPIVEEPLDQHVGGEMPDDDDTMDDEKVMTDAPRSCQDIAAEAAKLYFESVECQSDDECELRHLPLPMLCAATQSYVFVDCHCEEVAVRKDVNAERFSHLADEWVASMSRGCYPDWVYSCEVRGCNREPVRCVDGRCRAPEREIDGCDPWLCQWCGPVR